MATRQENIAAGVALSVLAIGGYSLWSAASPLFQEFRELQVKIDEEIELKEK